MSLAVHRLILVTTVILVLCSFPVNTHYRCSSYEEGQIRLRDGGNSREGRVDMCIYELDIYYEGLWLTPCNDSWGIDEIQVVCRELGFCSQGGTFVSEYYSFPIHFIEVNCSGNESALNNCSIVSYLSCDSFVAAGVNCSAEVPSTPKGVEITVLGSYTAIQVSWSPPDMSNCTDVDEYRVSCYALTVWTNLTTVNITLDYFYFSYYDYRCCVWGSNSAGLGPDSCAQRPRPTPPRNVTVIPIPLSSSLLVEWVEPESINGYFWRYQVMCGTQSSYSSSISQMTVTVTDLSIYTTYTCCVSVHNYVHVSEQECVNATTNAAPPSAPVNITISDGTATTIQLEWAPPEYNETLSHYIISCTERLSLVWNSSRVDTRENVTSLQPFTNYTCCVSASNQAGEGNQSCADTSTQPGPPTEPEGIITISTDVSSLTLAWRQPAKSYGQRVLFYNISCTSHLNHTVTIERVFNTSTRVMGLHSNTSYTCCVSAVSTVGVGDIVCLPVSTAAQKADKQESLGLVAAVSGGALLAVLVLLVVVITTIVICCFKKRNQVNKKREPTTDKPELNNTVPDNTYSVRYKPDYKEEVEIRYERPVLKSTAGAKTEKKEKEESGNKTLPPQEAQSTADQHTQHGQLQEDEKIYQPLIPPKTYITPTVSAEYQDLVFDSSKESRSQDELTDAAGNSEGQYEVVGRPEETNQYEPVTFSVSTSPHTDGVYQTLSKRDESSHYQDLHSVRT